MNLLRGYILSLIITKFNYNLTYLNIYKIYYSIKLNEPSQATPGHKLNKPSSS